MKLVSGGGVNLVVDYHDIDIAVTGTAKDFFEFHEQGSAWIDYHANPTGISLDGLHMEVGDSLEWISLTESTAYTGWRICAVRGDAPVTTGSFEFVGDPGNCVLKDNNCVMSHATAGPTRAGTEDYYTGEACTFRVVGTGTLEFSFMDAGTNAVGHLSLNGDNISDGEYYLDFDGMTLVGGDEFVFDATNYDDGFEVCIV